MRNILEYPVTDEEMLKALDRAIAEHDPLKDGFGSIHGLALRTARDKLAEVLKPDA